MNLITLKHRYDYGHDWYVQLLHTKRWALFQASVSWNDYASWPYLQIKSGTGSVLNIIFWAYKFGFDVGIIERTWNWGAIDQYIEDPDVEENDVQHTT